MTMALAIFLPCQFQVALDGFRLGVGDRCAPHFKEHQEIAGDGNALPGVSSMVPFFA
jgi:hypothetical protein